MEIILALVLVQLTKPDGQPIWFNPMATITVRPPTRSEHFGAGVRCLINTPDGKFVAVTEDCAEVRAKLQEEAPP